MVALMSAACSWSPDSREKELGQQGALSLFLSLLYFRKHRQELRLKFYRKKQKSSRQKENNRDFVSLLKAFEQSGHDPHE